MTMMMMGLKVIDATHWRLEHWTPTLVHFFQCTFSCFVFFTEVEVVIPQKEPYFLPLGTDVR
jgi:hypothetical protein